MTTDRRADDGRFTPGCAPGPGRPKRPRGSVADYLRVTMQTCTVETWATVVAKAVELAAAGDRDARQWLAGYLLGAPDAKAPRTDNVLINDLLGEDHILAAAAERLAKAQEPDCDPLACLRTDDSRMIAAIARARAKIEAAEESAPAADCPAPARTG